MDFGGTEMADPRYTKWANALTGFSAEVRPGNTVAILGGSAAEPLLVEIYRSVIERGGFPVHGSDLAWYCCADARRRHR